MKNFPTLLNQNMGVPKRIGKKFFQTPSSKFGGRGGGTLGKKNFFAQKKIFLTRNIEYSVSKTLRQKLRQV